MPHLHPEVKSLIDQIFFKMVKKPEGKKINKIKSQLKISFNNRSRFTQKGWKPSPPSPPGGRTANMASSPNSLNSQLSIHADFYIVLRAEEQRLLCYWPACNAKIWQSALTINVAMLSIKKI